jgi:beta-galactosidase
MRSFHGAIRRAARIFASYIGTLAALALTAATVCRCQELYVGSDYHPHDLNPAEVKRDIALMKSAGLNVVRMGHLAWDSYEPTDGHFDFAWFDDVMDQMNRAGIKVVLDVAVRPAPIWLHHKFPSIDVTDSSGNRLYPNHRYMEDVGDPAFQEYALRFADALVKHYAGHPALLAFGIDNEPGDGPISYSETVRKRFVLWLQRKYSTVDALNKAWAGQRWSRKISQFDEVGLPVSGPVIGQPERVLDFRRFISDEVNGYLTRLIGTVNAAAPQALTTTNMWYYSSMKYFDYSPIAYAGMITRAGCGVYSGDSLRDSNGLKGALFGIARIQFENTTPFWCTEFTTATAAPGSMRRSAYASLMYGNQMICGWTWQSMHAGEEQFLQGMVDWDGVPNRKYFEYGQIAREFRKIEKYGFPYKPKADIGLAFSFASQIQTTTNPEYAEPHDAQLQNCFELFVDRNLDTRVVEVSRSKLDFKLLIVPDMSVMDEASSRAIRGYVEKGGTIVMTAGSAMLDAHGQVFRNTLPGHLSDVFGIRVSGYEETGTLNELSREALTGDNLRIVLSGKSIPLKASRFDIVHAKDADVLGQIVSLDKDYPIVTSHSYGKGRAIYVGLPVRPEVLNPLLDRLLDELSVRKGPRTPADVMARQIDPRHILYLNLGSQPRVVTLKGTSRSVLHDRTYMDTFVINPYEPEFVETQ